MMVAIFTGRVPRYTPSGHHPHTAARAPSQRRCNADTAVSRTGRRSTGLHGAAWVSLGLLAFGPLHAWGMAPQATMGPAAGHRAACCACQTATQSFP